MSTPFSTVPLHPHLGVEVKGVKLRPGLDQAGIQALWQLLDEHSLLVFRDNPISDDDLLALSTQLGAPDGGVRRYKVEGPAPASAVPSRWHSHGGISGPDPAVLCVSSLNECPSEGGEIEFSAIRAAHDALDEGRRRSIDGLTAVHRFGAIAHSGGAGSNAGVRQPLVLADPVTGRRALFVGYHAVEIEGMPDAQAKPLLADLHQHSIQERFVYRHQWRPGDLLLWDLCALLHHTFPVRSRSNRTLHEVIVASRVPLAA
jgi:alpha-ketoglutarate-dependent taurine dioxygenase